MLADVRLLHTNSVQYNGEANPITAIALKIVKTCEEQFEEHADQFDLLERNIEQQALGHANPTNAYSHADHWFSDNQTAEEMGDYSYNPALEGMIEA